jgi:hypothetical protein
LLCTRLLFCGRIVNRAINADPKEAKRQRNREYYAKNKDDISRRQRQAQELKKQAASRDDPNDDNMSHTSSWTIRSHPTETQTPGHVFFTCIYRIFISNDSFLVNLHLQ